jgi:hypothetical protein
MDAWQQVIIYRLTRSLYSAPFAEVSQILALLDYMETWK